MPAIPATSDIPIFLATSQQVDVPTGPDGRAIVIIPDDSTWNDFSSNLIASLRFVGVGVAHRTLSMRLLVQGQSHTRLYVSRKLNEENAKSAYPIENIEYPFVSILGGEKDYRDFVAWLGFEDAIGCLRRMHDAVLARLENTTDEDESSLKLTQTITFHQSVVRDSETWVAFRQADRYLTPNRSPDVEEAAVSFTVKAKLRGMVGEHVLDADFGKDFILSRRIMVIVGQNGTGKTRLFKAIVDGLRIAPPWEQSIHLDNKAIFEPRPEFSRLIVFSSVASDPYPQALAPWEGIDYRYHRMIGTYGGEGGGLTMALVDCLRVDADSQGYDRFSALQLLDDVLEPLGISDNLYVELNESNEEDSLLTPIQIGDRNYLPLFSRRGEQRKLQLYARIRQDRPPIVMDDNMHTRHLSSGEVALMRFAAYSVSSLRRGTIFLFDEPETHLHPNYISQFMAMLDLLLEKTGSVALIATHSAFVVREVPSRRVRMITRNSDDGSIVIDPPTMQTFGASIDTISQFVFSDIGPKHRFQRILEQYVKEHPDETLFQVRDHFIADLNPEMLSYIAELVERRDKQ